MMMKMMTTDDRVDDIDGDEKTTNTSTDLLTKPDDIEVHWLRLLFAHPHKWPPRATLTKKAVAMTS